MNTVRKVAVAGINPVKTKGNFYLWLNLSLGIIFPVLCIVSEHKWDHVPFDWQLTGKWFIFWTVGIRLFTAGIKQASMPEFTGTKIFSFKSKESYVVIRELGFANMSLGAMGILSVINEQWRLIAAITGGLFLGLAGLQHCLKTPATKNELIALLYDLFSFLMLALYVILH